jgi:GT2 family glycosyltransferase
MPIHLSNQTLTNQTVCSVCIANYNGIAVIHDCLNALMEQDCNFQIEIIVHDDASTDGSVDFIRNNFPDIVLIASNENVGFCISNNRMVKKAHGKYILILNNDAILYPDALRVFHKHAEIIKRPAILGLRQYNAETGDLIDFGILLDPFMNSIPNKNLQRTEVAMMIGACLWLPKTLWEIIGGFPEWFHTMHEDMYVCCMARLYGYPVEVIPQSGYKHWVGNSLGGGKVVNNRLFTPLKRRALSERNRIYVMVLCYPDPLFKIVFPFHILLLVLEGIMLSVLKKDLKVLNYLYLSSIRSFWKNRKKLFSNRYRIQKQRAINCRMFLSAVSPMPHKLKMLMKHGFPEIT